MQSNPNIIKTRRTHMHRETEERINIRPSGRERRAIRRSNGKV